MKIKSFEWPKSISKSLTKIMLGTSDAWATSHLSQRTNEPELIIHIVDCRIFYLLLSESNCYQ